ncbi:MAG: glutamate-5-semialdehyde dehydrogenase [Elusimicrobia bacterium CG1_02_37_114]|nr:MAG: glutamate-5-semialdehyde dehydrogenase [Elusimicrobia bacterium CG1_02_37_114]PIV52247.1 MAG: glutamate-5-semialdehyde dehydrogenase [Elusimicrobia bacterium CG02_land_8_20_14_3_00_37_13]PIZ13446.1 MAG: glutamate-5-semialdehyde dehydrogenase [Elusimicrobia bacterium CG_4_10_14_0_8_um_filter_37_32]
MTNPITKKAKIAKTSSRKLASLSTEIKNRALVSIVEEIEKNTDKIISQNKIDIKKTTGKNLSSALIDRLMLNEKRIKEMAKSVLDIAELPDPVGEIISEWNSPSGFLIKKTRVPLGVIAIIYESRPNVTVDSTALCLKSGNAVILRGGSESINSNRILVEIISGALKSIKGMPEGVVQFIDTPDRLSIYEIIKLDNFIDLVIPRGGEKMIRQIREKSVVPVLSHGKGLCHTYIDKSADIDMAIKIAFNAKVQRPGVCNAMETLLVHKDIADKILPALAEDYKKANVELRGCPKTLKILTDIKKAKKEDWSTEYLDLILSVKIVDSIDRAIEHINEYGSGHTDSIITEDKKSAEKFLTEVDSSAVFHNASTRLHDGGVFGLGSEIGISTQKLHARGTMGLKELTTTKYVVYGTGEIRI